MSIGSFVDFNTLDSQAQQLIHEGMQARSNAYSRYSHFKVGSALRCDDGSIQSGCNVESASYPVTMCAERNALCAAVARGKRSFRAISVVAEKIDGRLTTPCGMCRQMLSEFGDFVVYVASPELDRVLVTSTHELLPLGFRSDGFSNTLTNDRS
ncbi:hypothetical protein QAD02_012005 [Eretmocerus hayati]|uniref:Uncharacterized protein n=1 Tax=Eretmocerus hayati TaxID=131215 RepID=A0ACC2P116_9HYME|nr:hypothetical protein QAD02_012005 [Eretmocerus hayati]